MIVFVGMETSGALRTRFQALGHYVVSCDTLPSEDGVSFDPVTGGHLQMDVFACLDMLAAMGIRPDLGVFHPTCTYLTNSAAWAYNDPDYARYPEVGYHQRVKAETLTGELRRRARAAALADVRKIMALPIARKAMENPVGAIGTAIRKPSQIIQPYQFGDDASKGTCLWFFDETGLPLPAMRLPIDPAKRVPGRQVSCVSTKSDTGFVTVERWSNQTDSGQNRLSPGEDRWKERSRTFPGIADAMAQHWGKPA